MFLSADLTLDPFQPFHFSYHLFFYLLSFHFFYIVSTDLDCNEGYHFIIKGDIYYQL